VVGVGECADCGGDEGPAILLAQRVMMVYSVQLMVLVVIRDLVQADKYREHLRWVATIYLVISVFILNRVCVEMEAATSAMVWFVYVSICFGLSVCTWMIEYRTVVGAAMPVVEKNGCLEEKQGLCDGVDESLLV